MPSANAAAKAACVMAGMLAGADSIDDLDLPRHGGMRSFTFGHVRELDAVHTRVLAGLATVVPRLLAGVDGLAFIDIDDTIREVHGYAKQGAAYGYSGVKGLNAQIAALSSPTCAPVIAASRLRKGNVVSGHGGDRMVIDAIATARAAGACGQVMVRAAARAGTLARSGRPGRSGRRWREGSSSARAARSSRAGGSGWPSRSGSWPRRLAPVDRRSRCRSALRGR